MGQKQQKLSTPYTTVADFLRNAKESPVAAELHAELTLEASKTVLDQARLRRQEDWSALANQVVGAEVIQQGG